MKQNFIKNEYTPQQWEKLIDDAILLGCKIEYTIYGNTCIITYPDLNTLNKHIANN